MSGYVYCQNARLPAVSQEKATMDLAPYWYLHKATFYFLQIKFSTVWKINYFFLMDRQVNIPITITFLCSPVILTVTNNCSILNLSFIIGNAAGIIMWVSQRSSMSKSVKSKHHKITPHSSAREFECILAKWNQTSLHILPHLAHFLISQKCGALTLSFFVCCNVVLIKIYPVFYSCKLINGNFGVSILLVNPVSQRHCAFHRHSDTESVNDLFFVYWLEAVDVVWNLDASS